MRLTAVPEGPLGLTAPDGSLGGLVLPRTMALDDQGTLYLLAMKPRAAVKRFNPAASRDPRPFGDRPWFVPLPDPAGHGRIPFQSPAGLAVSAGRLFVAVPDESAPRVEIFSTADGRLLALWNAEVAKAALPLGERGGDPWKPADVIAAGEEVYVVDQRHARVFRIEPGAEAPCPFFAAPERAGRWSRMAVDRRGLIYLLDAQPPDGPAALDVYHPGGTAVLAQDPDGAWSPWRVHDAGSVRGDFDPPPVRADYHPQMEDRKDGPPVWRFCLPASLMPECPREVPPEPPPPEDPLRLCRQGLAGCTSAGIVFNSNGDPVPFDPEAPAGDPLYPKRGFWYSNRLDSLEAGCEWHRLEIEFDQLPPGSAVAVRTWTDEEPRDGAFIAGESVAESDWIECGDESGDPQPAPHISPASLRPCDFLVQSPPGRFLWVRVELLGDGYATPVIGSIRIHYPRRTYLDDLPAVYQQDADSRRFLQQFLSAFHTEWDALEQRAETFARYLHPASVPDEPSLAWLAGWLGVRFEGDWDFDQKRRFLEAMPAAMFSEAGADRAGTIGSLRRRVQALIESITGLEPDEQAAFPVFLEGFRERDGLQLAVGDKCVLGSAVPAWSRSVVGRLQLNAFSRIGDVRLVSTGDPHRDLFDQFAHRFRVFLPAAWVRTAEDEDMIRRDLDAETPAGARHELTLVEPAFRIGVQSLLGVDSILGDCGASARLGCADGPDTLPSAAHRPRLGIDTVLQKPGAKDKSFRKQPPRLGLNTILTQPDQPSAAEQRRENP